MLIYQIGSMKGHMLKLPLKLGSNVTFLFITFERRSGFQIYLGVRLSTFNSASNDNTSHE